ncbi:MAG: hypothetical protein EXQ52_05825 [Bryobacterales bacterium]|nr:hypothetical protein [Bryobacterales bacterium]
MAKILFVHGVGTREMEYAAALRTLHINLPAHHILPCLWGDACGAKLHLGGKSIPEYDSSKEGAAPREEDVERARWWILYQDPLFEIRLLEGREGERLNLPPSRMQPGEEAVEKARNLTPPPEFLARLQSLGMDEFWDEAHRQVAGDERFAGFIEQANLDLLDTTKPVARALVASLLALAEEAGVPGVTGQTRDELVELLQIALGGKPLGILKWGESMLERFVVNPLVRRGGPMVHRYAAGKFREHRRGLFDEHSSKMADILVYQARGQPIRDFILKSIAAAGEDVFVLAHSLGGVACVDLLIERRVPNVRALITAGSQAPFFYELDALTSLRVGEPLPGHFPEWVNFYDPADFLSFQGGEVFPGRVRDVMVDSGQPFPAAHSAYWNNPDVLAALRAIPKV